MKVINILKDICQELNIEKKLGLLGSVDENNDLLLGDPLISKLLKFINVAMQDLCVNYLAVQTEVPVMTINKTIQVNQLKNFIRAQNAFRNGNLVKYKLINRKMIFEEDGTYIVQYLTFPEFKSLWDCVDFLPGGGPECIVYAACAFYCLSNNLINRFKMYSEKYNNHAEEIKSFNVINLPKGKM